MGSYLGLTIGTFWGSFGVLEINTMLATCKANTWSFVLLSGPQQYDILKNYSYINYCLYNVLLKIHFQKYSTLEHSSVCFVAAPSGAQILFLTVLMVQFWQSLRTRGSARLVMCKASSLPDVLSRWLNILYNKFLHL